MSVGGSVPALVERDVWIPMRDGVRMQTDIWRPADGLRHPILLQRTPYNRADSFATIVTAGIEPLRAVAAGFVVVISDTRGRFGSEGFFEPFKHEALDGFDTVQWLAQQSYSNGRVGMYGASYYAATQLLAATAQPPALSALATQMTASDYHDTWTYRGGALELGFTLYWAIGLAAAELERRRGAGERLDAEAEALNALAADPHAAFERRPLCDIYPLTTLLPAWNEWVTHPDRDDYWKSLSPLKNLTSSAIPTLHIGGWFDIFLPGTLANYTAMSAASSAAGTEQRLVVGPWAHAACHDALGEVYFGSTAAAASLDLTQLQLDWFTQHLTNEPVEVDEPPVRVFCMNANVWQTFDEWPPAAAVTTPYYFASDGTLSPEDQSARDAAREPEDHSTFVYDPANPAPTIGGATFLPGAYVGHNAGPRDQRPVEAREDVLSFTSARLTRDLDVIGRVRVVLHASTTAADTDWTAAFVDVHPDGRAIKVCDGIVRARYRHGTDAAEPITPNATHEYVIDLGATAIRVAAGHALRVDVSSSSFPKFDPNANDGGPTHMATEADYVTATQRIWHDATKPSRLELPIIPRPPRAAAY